MIYIVLAIIFALLAICLYDNANKIDKSSIASSKSANTAPAEQTYWESFKSTNPTKANEMEDLLNIDFSMLANADAKEKKETLERLSKSMRCPISQLKENYLKEIDKYPASLIPQMIETTSKEITREKDFFHIKEENTASALMVKWLKERHRQLGSPDACISASATEKEIAVAKSYFPYIDEEDIQERIKSLREMPLLLKCPLEELEKFYKDDVLKEYGGIYSNFQYLINTYKSMANKAYEVAPKVALKPQNTSYGIMCDWLYDVMKTERKKFIDKNEVKCPYCRCTDIKMSIFNDAFQCKSCGRSFGGI